MTIFLGLQLPAQATVVLRCCLEGISLVVQSGCGCQKYVKQTLPVL